MEPVDPVFGGETFLIWFEAAVAWLLGEVLTPANVVYTAMQIPAIVGAGFASWWVHDFIHPVIAERIKRATVTDYAEGVLLTLASLIFPILWMVGLWISIVVSGYFGWPNNIIWLSINLLTAWIVIRLASILVRDPFWSRIIAIVAYTIAALNVLHVLEPTLDLLDRLAITVGRLRISVLIVLEGMLWLGVLLWAAVLISRILEKRVQKLPNLTPSVRVLIGKLFKATLVALAVVVSLTSIGIDLTALAVFGGAVGVGIGFGLQKVVSNLISGIILLMDKSIKPGDIIQLEDKYGWIASLGARYVSVETRDGTEFLIPNEDIITKQVVNWTHQNDLARLKVQIRVAYEADIRKALKLMKEAGARPARVLKEPAPNPLVLGFGDSWVDLELRFWIRDVRNGIRNISSEVMLEIWGSFREHDIGIPFPRREVYMHTLPPLATTPDSSANGSLSDSSAASLQPSEAFQAQPAQTHAPTRRKE